MDDEHVLTHMARLDDRISQLEAQYQLIQERIDWLMCHHHIDALSSVPVHIKVSGTAFASANGREVIVQRDIEMVSEKEGEHER